LKIPFIWLSNSADISLCVLNFRSKDMTINCRDDLVRRNGTPLWTLQSNATNDDTVRCTTGQLSVHSTCVTGVTALFGHYVNYDDDRSAPIWRVCVHITFTAATNVYCSLPTATAAAAAERAADCSAAYAVHRSSSKLQQLHHSLHCSSNVITSLPSYASQQLIVRLAEQLLLKLLKFTYFATKANGTRTRQTSNVQRQKTTEKNETEFK